MKAIEVRQCEPSICPYCYENETTGKYICTHSETPNKTIRYRWMFPLEPPEWCKLKDAAPLQKIHDLLTRHQVCRELIQELKALLEKVLKAEDKQ